MKQIADRLERCRLASPVPAQQGSNATLGYFQTDTFQHKDHMIVDHFDIVDFQQCVGLHVGCLGSIQHGVSFRQILLCDPAAVLFAAGLKVV